MHCFSHVSNIIIFFEKKNKRDPWQRRPTKHHRFATHGAVPPPAAVSNTWHRPTTHHRFATHGTVPPPGTPRPMAPPSNQTSPFRDPWHPHSTKHCSFRYPGIPPPFRTAPPRTATPYHITPHPHPALPRPGFHHLAPTYHRHLRGWRWDARAGS